VRGGCTWPFTPRIDVSGLQSGRTVAFTVVVRETHPDATVDVHADRLYALAE
jgi:hypothetical protein